MNRTILTLVSGMILPCLAPVSAFAHDMGNHATVKPLIAQDIASAPGKEALLLEVNFAPGGSDPAHRHDAVVFVYVLEGAIEMQVKGGPVEILHKGQVFQENPGDIHVIGRNASKTKPAKFLAFFVKDKETPPVIPVK